MVLFCLNEILHDNQAGRSIFNDKALLYNVTTIASFYIGGIDYGSRGLHIDQEDDFEDLCRVAC